MGHPFRSSKNVCFTIFEGRGRGVSMTDFPWEDSILFIVLCITEETSRGLASYRMFIFSFSSPPSRDPTAVNSDTRGRRKICKSDIDLK